MLWARVRRMLELRERMERRRCAAAGGGEPRRAYTTAAVVRHCYVLNASTFDELRGADILLHEDIRVTAHTRRRAAQVGVELWSASLFRLPRPLDAYMPEHALLAAASEPYEGRARLPAMMADDPAARYFGAAPGEVWRCDFDERCPPRLIKEA